MNNLIPKYAFNALDGNDIEGFFIVMDYVNMPKEVELSLTGKQYENLSQYVFSHYIPTVSYSISAEMPRLKFTIYGRTYSINPAMEHNPTEKYKI